MERWAHGVNPAPSRTRGAGGHAKPPFVDRTRAPPAPRIWAPPHALCAARLARRRGGRQEGGVCVRRAPLAGTRQMLRAGRPLATRTWTGVPTIAMGVAWTGECVVAGLDGAGSRVSRV